jgi:hypothetical protein
MTSLTESIGTALASWVGWTLRFRKVTILSTLGAAALGAYYAAGNLGVNTDTANMISAELPWRQHFIDYREAFPARDRNLLIVIDAATPEQSEDFAAALLAELRLEPALYRDVFLPGEGEFFERNGLLYLAPDALEQLADRLAAAQPLIGLLQRDFSGAAVVDVANRTLADAGSNEAAAGAVLAPFYMELAQSLRAVREGGSDPFAWDALIESRGEPATRRIIVLQPALDFTRLQPASAAMAGIRHTVARLNSPEATAVTVRLTGSVAMEHEELLSVSQGAGLGALATLVMVAIVLYGALRSWKLLLICVVTLVAGLSLTAAFAAVAIGHLNLLSIAFVVLNIGLGSDYVIHVCLRQKELTAQGMQVEAALVETMRGVGASLGLCAVTTAAGFYSFVPTQFEGVSELGLIAGTGVFISLLVSVTLLPALIAQWVSPNPERDAKTWINPRIFVPLNRRPQLVLAATAVVVLVSLAALPSVTFDSNPIHLRDPESESVQTLLELADDGDAPLFNLVAVAPDRDTAQRWSDEVSALATVRNVVTVESLVPRDQAHKLSLLEDMALILGPDFGRLTRSPPDPDRLGRALEELRAHLQERPAAATGVLQQAVVAFLDHVETMPAGIRRQALLELDRLLTERLPGELQRLEAGLQAGQITRDDLPDSLAARWLGGGRELIEISPEENVNENAAAERFVDSVRGVVDTATGLPVVYEEASNTIVRAFKLALAYAFVMVTAIMWVVLRRPRDVLLVIVPILLAAAATAGMTALIGMPLNYANIIALPLLVGIGVDNGIHVVHRMRTDPRATELFNTSTLRAVLASGLTTMASFGNLAFSAHVGTSSMGKLLVIGLTISMAATLIVLPAWLKAYGAPARTAAIG